MPQIKTSLSAGQMIRSILLEDEEVSARVTKIFPVDTTEARLPYIVYRRAGMEPRPTKSGRPASDWIQEEIYCYCASYTESVELAELVRNRLDNLVAEDCGYRISGCYLSDSEEGYENDAFIQKLVFSIKI
ncbi:MAG: DUF3168 domain-containing protein [Bacteroides sp.]|nr:DUF3168 domain-containing protein [Bacteroides sp.]